MDKKIIKQVRIDQSNMTSLSSSRTLSIAGEVGAEFIVNVIKINSTSKESYYNFKTKSFTTAFTSKNSFRLKMAGSSFQLAILFPADATGDVYSILVMAKPETTQFSNGQFVVTKKITQVGQTTVFLEVDEGRAIDIDDSFKHKTNAEMFEFIKNELDFDQLIWEFGSDKNPDWLHVSYVSPEENRNRILQAYREDGKTKYKII